MKGLYAIVSVAVYNTVPRSALPLTSPATHTAFLCTVPYMKDETRYKLNVREVGSPRGGAVDLSLASFETRLV